MTMSYDDETQAAILGVLGDGELLGSVRPNHTNTRLGLW